MATRDPSPPPISLGTLLDRIADDSVPLDQIEPYLVFVPSSNGSIDPMFQPNPSLVTGLETGLESSLVMNVFNATERRRRNLEYAKKIAQNPNRLRIVEEGDSWFQYPIRLDDIIDFLSAETAVYSLSGAGHTLAQMIDQNEVIHTIARERAHAFVLSAGGNDLFQNGNIANLVEVRGNTAVIGDVFHRFLDEIIGQYRRLLGQVHQAFPSLVMAIHGYSAAFPRGSQWIGQPLARKGIRDPRSQAQIVAQMLDRFNAAQIALTKEAQFDGKLVHVDLRPLARSPSDWFDEIHMGPEANRQAAQLFADALTEALQSGLEGGLESGTAAASIEETRPVAAVSAHARELAALDEGMLLAELQARLDLIDRDPAAADLPASPLLILSGGLESGTTPEAGPLARRLLRRWELELYDLICGEGEDDTAERKRMRDALGLDTDMLIAALAGWLVSGPLGVSALLAGVLAAILVRRFGGATAEVVCQTWKERLDV